ncbi:HU family DNA-binding protein [Streptomyces rubiginosohelvolus]|uniref:HU family DNA-binding protein n=1 Tax=Streptomyces rubiginosohelvolus TaxID=67362 RepID=UPI0033A359BD
MNRSELVASISERADVSRAAADAILAALAETVGDIVAKGDEKVTIPGFLTFERIHRAARTGRNPQTGAALQVPASYGVKVSAGSKLRAAAKG